MGLTASRDNRGYAPLYLFCIGGSEGPFGHESKEKRISALFEVKLCIVFIISSRDPNKWI
jgi:hypothetical protein